MYNYLLEKCCKLKIKLLLSVIVFLVICKVNGMFLMNKLFVLILK